MSGIAVQQRGRMFVAAAVGTLAIGVAVAVAVIFHLRPPPPVVVPTPPETRVVEKVVYKESPNKPAQQPSPPAVPVVQPPAAPPPPPPAATITTGGMWNGVWRRKAYPLPMFRLSQRSEGVAGTCDANWGDIVQFGGGKIEDDTLEFVVDDKICRIHVRMTMIGDDKAKVEQWVTDEDWEISLERANKAARTPQQALLARAVLEQNASRFRKPVTVGTFLRQAEK